MKLLLENWREYLNERVYGNLISVYSRTTSESAIASIATDGWKVGNYGDWGPAIYMVYGFGPSDYADRTYGTHVMKLALKANNKLLIFEDPEAMKKIYGKEVSIEEQLMKISPESLKDPSIIAWIRGTEYYAGSKLSKGPRGAPIEKLKKYINGFLVKSDSHKDGHTAVLYNSDDVLTLLSWAKIPKDYKFKTDAQEREAIAQEDIMISIRYTIAGEYLEAEDPWDLEDDPRLQQIEDIIVIIQEQDGARAEDLVSIEDVANYFGIIPDSYDDMPMYRNTRTYSHETDYSHVSYDEKDLQWKKNIKGIALPQKVKMS